MATNSALPLTLGPNVAMPRLAAASAVIFMLSSTWPFFGPEA